MILNVDFYNDIFKQEQKWIELINDGLINSIYCNLVLKPFYIKKREEMYNSNNKILEQIKCAIDEILIKLEEFNTKYRNLEQVDVREILPYFLVNKMSNNTLSEEEPIHRRLI